MNTTQSARRFVITSLLALLAPIVLFAPQADAETYVAGQMGVTLPSIGSGLSNTDLTGVFIQGSTLSDQALTSSILYGAKVGHYFTADLGRHGSRSLQHNTSHQATGNWNFLPRQGQALTLHDFPGCALPRTHTRTTERDISLPQDTTSTIHWPSDLEFSLLD